MPPTVRVAGMILVRTKGGVLRQSYTEADLRVRQAMLPEFAFSSVARRMEEVGRDDVEQLLFVTRNGTPRAPHNVRRTIREILQLAGVQRIDLDGIPAPRLHDETPAIWLGQ